MFEKLITHVILATFFLASIGPFPDASAQNIIDLPAPGMMVNTSITYQPLELKGIQINTKDPLRFDFLVDKGESNLYGQPLKDEIIRLTKYFLTCLTVPEEDLWVNLSPYEKDRIVPNSFGITLMGKNLLEQDYLLKQIMASLSYPENELGKRFWQRVYRKSYELYGTTEIPINTFNKVWIVPKTAEVYARGNSAFVVKGQLDVMLEADYKAFVHHLGKQGSSQYAGAYSQVFRDVILPELRQEVNEGKNFTVVRQVYDAMILATWYKRHLKNSLLGRSYVGRNKVMGVDIADKNIKEKIFQQYLQAYKKCVYNYIKEDYDPFTQQTVPRKYASGGVFFGDIERGIYVEEPNFTGTPLDRINLAMASIKISLNTVNGRFIDPRTLPDNAAMMAPVLSSADAYAKEGDSPGSFKQGKSEPVFWKRMLLPVVQSIAGIQMTSQMATDNAQSNTLTDNKSINAALQLADEDSEIAHARKLLASRKQQLENLDLLNARILKLINEIKEVNREIAGLQQKLKHPPKAGTVNPKHIEYGIHVLKELNLEKEQLIKEEQSDLLIAKSITKPKALIKLPFVKEISQAVSDAVPSGVLNPESEIHEKQPNKPSDIVSEPSAGGAPPPPTSGLFNFAVPPPAATPEEKSILAEDLAKLRAVANGTIAPSQPIPAQNETKGPSVGQDLRLLNLSSLLGTLGLSMFLTGGISSIVPLSGFIAAGMYEIQQWLGEMFHLGTASAAYLTTDGITKDNLKGNKSLGQRLKSLLPWNRTKRSFVDLPFAKNEGTWKDNWFNKLRHHLVAKSGLIGSMALPFLAAHFIGLTPLLAPLVLSALFVIKGHIDSGDLSGSTDTDQGIFGCGIVGFLKRVPIQGVNKKDMQSWTTWYFRGLKESTPRGGQQAGVASPLAGENGFSEQTDEKITKEKRNWKIWKGWDQGPVFYRSMIKDLQERFYADLPKKLVPVYNYAKFGVLKFLGHVRFATGGDMVQDAAHPQSSPDEIREQWVWDSVKNIFRKVIRNFNVTSAFNGDTDAAKLGVNQTVELFGQPVGFRQMRTFFSAAVHSYYKKKITIKYLKRTVDDGKKYKQVVRTDYSAVLEALRKKGYVNPKGYASDSFIKLDDEFKSGFPNYTPEVFNEIECALFGIPPGDAPINPRAEHLFLTQGSGWASMRYAHVMVNHQNVQEATEDILFEKEGRAVGSIYSEVYDQVQPYLSRRGYTPDDPEKVRTLNDNFVKDKETAQKLGLEDQYQMLQIFKEMLDKRMRAEAQQQTLAGEVFRGWEKKWIAQGRDVEEMRRKFIDVAVEKFFTADTTAATKEFAERMEGTFGTFMQNPLDDSITLYQDNQDVVVGINREEGVIAFGSDPRSLKTIGPKGEKINEIMPLKDKEVVNLSFSPSGKIVIKSWIRDDDGVWKETSKEDIEQRFYPTADYVNGEKNPYYAQPPVEYKNPHRIVQEDFQNIPKIIKKAKEELEDPDSFNSQSTQYLAERINDNIRKKGHARLVIIGYDNSRKIAEHFKQTSRDLIRRSKLNIDVIDANKFDLSPSEYNIQPDDIVLIVSKSGATFSSKLALRLCKKLANEENIFCMTARIDSVLTILNGQGLRPKDPFTKRMFFTGEFYPAETPMASEVLLLFQMQQLAVNLGRALGRMNDPQNSLGLRFTPRIMERMSQQISNDSITLAQQLTGYDVNGEEYPQANKAIKKMGNDLGWFALEPWWVSRSLDVFVGGILAFPAILLSHHIGWWGIIPDVIAIRYLVPFLSSEVYRWLVKRAPFARLAAYDLFIAGPPMIASTQRNFISRIMTNRPKTIAPGAIYGENPTEDFVATHASDQKRGDINLRFSLEHNANIGRMGVNQATYPQTGVLGTNFWKGRPQNVDVVVKIPLVNGATMEEMSLMDDTIGTLGMMIAAKALGNEMARVASFDGRLFDLAYTFSSAGVHTTQINPISDEARGILKFGRSAIVKRNHTDLIDEPVVVETDPAMRVSQNPHQIARHGGIDMSSRLMQLKVTGEAPNRIGGEDAAMSVVAIGGVVPEVSGIVQVTPEMLQAMLGPGYLN